MNFKYLYINKNLSRYKLNKKRRANHECNS